MSRTVLLLLISLVSSGLCASAKTPTPQWRRFVLQDYPISYIFMEIADYAKENPRTYFTGVFIMGAIMLTLAIKEKNRKEELLEKEKQLEAILEKIKLEKDTKQEDDSWAPKNGDRTLLFFISEVRNIFGQMSTFTKTWTSYINNLDDFYGIDCELEYFYQYMIRLAENGTKLVQLEDTLQMDDFSKEDWAWSKEMTKVFSYEGCGFVESVQKIVDYVEEYAASQKEYMDSVTNETVLGLNKKLEQFVKNGRAFIKSVEEKDAIEADFDVVPNI